jgi:4-amino-4-deoxy-L-arabinose transferase-like glycosyltransferase
VNKRTVILTALALAVLAGGLRFYRLGAWPFFGDELATFNEAQCFSEGSTDQENSQVARISQLIPVSYLVHKADYALFGRDEFGSRALMALLGTALVVIAFLGLVGPLGFPAALASSLLLAVWPEHVYQSQQHRFYMTAAFFSSLAMLMGSWAVHRRSLALAVCACLAAFAAILSHTLQGVVLAGLFAGFLLAAWAGRQPLPLARLSVVIAAGALAGCFMLFFLLPRISEWNSGEGWGAGPFHSLLASTYELGWPVALLAGLGAISVVRNRDGQGCYWLAWAGVWTMASVVFPLIVVYHSAYVFPLMLGAIVLAGYAAAQIYGHLRRQSLFLAGAWFAVVAALNFPSLLSHYSDGSRHDYRQAARFIENHWQHGDQVAAVAPGALRRYAEVCQDAISLKTWDPLPDLKELSLSPRRLWIVIPSDRPGKPEPLRRWLGLNCTQQLEIRPRRFDYRENIVEVYLYSPQAVATAK